MQVDLYKIYKDHNQSRQFIFSAVCYALKVMGKDITDLPTQEDGTTIKPVELKLSINGEDVVITDFFERFIGAIDSTIENGTKAFAEKKAERLLLVIGNLTESLTREIAALAPEHYSEDD